MLLKQVKKTIKNNSLLKKGDKVLIGLSGGADSVCLTHLLRRLRDEYGLTLYTAHLNHGLRGAEADADADYAREFSKSLGIKCVVGSADVRAYAEFSGQSEETAGRELRYEFFKDVMTELELDKIATAHNRNDNAETITMNFIRGATLSGLSGIPYRRGNIIRPILDITRSEIEEYCKLNGLRYVTDRTNNEDIYTRNKIRHNIIPEIEENFNPNFINTVSKNAELIRYDEDYINTVAKEAYERLVRDNSIEIPALLGCHRAIQSRIIRMMIGADMNNISSSYIDDILCLAKTGKTGAEINLPHNLTAKTEYGRLIIAETEDAVSDYEYTLPVGDEIYIKEARIYIRAEYANERADDGAQYFTGSGEIKVRNRRDGDVFYPAGMGGKKSVGDYFTDEKIPKSERARIPIVTIGGEIAYIVGHRRDERFKFRGSGVKLTFRKIQ